MAIIRFVALACLGLTVAGCGWMGIGKSDFACPGGSTDGVRCLSARQVYQATERSDTVRPTAGPGSEDRESANMAGMPPLPPVQGTGKIPLPTLRQPLPIRTQAQVMRIWMAPWEDESGDLHADGYLYTEVEGRRWNLGEKIDSPNAGFSPVNTGAYNLPHE